MISSVLLIEANIYALPRVLWSKISAARAASGSYAWIKCYACMNCHGGVDCFSRTCESFHIAVCDVVCHCV